MSGNQYIVFTLPTCSHCVNLKNKISKQISAGKIKCINLNNVSKNSSEMNLFKLCSPNMNVPAMIVLAGGRLKAKAVGIDPIMKLLNQ